MQIKQFVIKTLELKQEEYSKFILLFFHSFFLGFFIALYFVPANSNFIEHFGSDWLPIAYIAAGFAGYLCTLVYSYFQKHVSSLSLFLGALLFMMFIALISRLAYSYIGLNSVINEKWLSFFVFIWGWPFISLVGIESGGLAIRHLNLRQVKRLFGFINMGGVIASIIGYLAIPLLMSFFDNAYDLLYIATLGILVSIALLFILYKRFPEKKNQSETNEADRKKTGFRELIKSKYFALIFISAILSMTAIYLTDFGFLVSIKKQGELLNSPERVSAFMAVVFGILKIGELLLSYFSSRILSKYGVKIGLVILPFISTVLIILATITGIISGAQSILFFLFIVLNKTFERVLRRALDDPSFNILYQPLPDEQKLSIQTKVGVVMQVSIGIAGIFLLGANELLHTETGYNLKFFPILFLPILIAWLFVALKLYNAYREKIRQILKEKNQKKEIGKQDIYGTEILSKSLKDKNPRIIERSVTLLSETNPRELELHAVNLLEYTNNEAIIHSILKNINPTYRQEFKKVIGKIQESIYSSEIKILADRALKHLDYSSVSKINENSVSQLNTSKSIEDKYLLAKYIFLHKTPNDAAIVLNLIYNEDKDIKRIALKLAGKRNDAKLRRILIEMLRNPEYSHLISSTLLEVGEKVLDELDVVFRKETSLAILLKIIEIYAKIGTKKAKSLLVSHLNYPGKDVQLAIIKALFYCHYQIEDLNERAVVKQKLEEIVENILWAFVCINDIESEKNTLKLIQALDLEREHNFEILFMLLSFMFQPATIDLIKTNIIGENTIFALEIIENFISQDIKLLIIPLFDKISVNLRMKKLRFIFPMRKLPFEERLKDILTRDFNKVDLWTMAKAIELFGKIYRRKKTNEENNSNAENSENEKTGNWSLDENHIDSNSSISKTNVPKEIFVCLYHPDELVYSTAAKLIYDDNPDICINYLENLPGAKQELIETLTNPDETFNLLIERVKLIKRIPQFFSVPENVLVKLVKLFKAHRIKKREKVYLKAEDNTEDVIILLRGMLTFHKNGDSEISFVKNDIISRGSTIDKNAEFLTAKKDAILLKGNRFDFYNLLADEIEIIQPMFQMIRKDT